MSKFTWTPHFDKFTRVDPHGLTRKRDILKEGKNEVIKFIERLNDFRFRNTPFSPRKIRKIKWIPEYKFTVEGGEPRLFRRLLDFRKGEVPVADNKYSRLVGYTPDHVGTIPGKVYPPVNHISRAIYSTMDELKKYSTDLYDSVYKVLMDFRYTLSPGWQCNMGHMRQFMSEECCKVTEEEYLEVLRRGGLSWFRAPVVEYENSNEIYWITNVNIKASTGHYTSKLLGRTREATLHITSVVARKMLNTLQTTLLKNFSLWAILGRSKDVKVDEEGKEVFSRVVLNTEEPAMLLLSYFANKINRCLVQCPDHQSVSGKKYDFSIANQFNQAKRKFDFYVDADWSAFDSYADRTVLMVAMSIILSQLPNDKFHKRIRYYIMSSMITKYILVPPGLVYEVNKGIPSGHPFTNVVGSFINLLYWAYIGYNIYGDDYTDHMFIRVNGDDARVYFDFHPKLVKIDTIVEKMGLKCDALLPRLHPCFDESSPHSKPDFLKRRENLFGIYWNREKIIQKIVYQSKPRTIQDEIDLLDGYVETAPFDEDMNWYLDLLRLYLLKYTIVRYGMIPSYKSLTIVANEKRIESYMNTTALQGLKFELSVYDNIRFSENEVLPHFHEDNAYLHYALQFSTEYLSTEKDNITLCLHDEDFNFKDRPPLLIFGDTS